MHGGRKSSGASFTCSNGKATVDNVELYRDVYYKTPRGSRYLHAISKATEVHLGGREYFALGDNSPSSNDSRAWGVVPQENLVGEAFLVIWPIWRIQIIR